MLQKFSNAEFIFVDDGSSDKSLEILKEYQKIDNRIVVFSQNNKGPGIARNSGIAMAKGKYITFLDSDDVMESECLKSFYELAEKMNCDLVICKANCFGEDISKKKIAGWCLRKEFLPLKHVFTPEDAQKNLFLISAGAPWGKFYRTSLIRDNNIQFPDLPRAEDFSFVYTCFVLAKKITTISAELINYRMLDNSSSLETAKDKFPTATAQGHKILYERLNALSVYDTYKNAFENNFIHSVTNQLNSFKEENSKKLLEKALRELNENFLKIDFSDISRFVFKNETMNLMKIIDLKKYNEYNKTPIIENTNITPKIVQNNVTILNDKKKSDKKISRKIKTAKRVFKEEGMRGIFKVIKGKISN